MLSAEAVAAKTVAVESGQPHTRVSFARLLTRALGVSFLSVLSIGLALFAYATLPQVQDLFFDVRPYWHQGALYWFWFYIIGVFFWAFPLVFTARLLLLQNYQDIGVDTPARYNIIVYRVPSAFAMLAFFIVLLGIYLAASNLPLDTGTSDAERLLRRYLTSHILWLFGFTALFALFVFYRGIFVRQYFRFMESFEQKRPKTFRRLLIGFERLASRHHRDLSQLSFHLEELKPAFLDRESYIASQRGKVFMMLYLMAMSAVMLTLVAIHFMSYSSFAIAQFSPLTMADWPDGLRQVALWISDTLWLQRAALLPMLFGGWLPFVAFLALLSNRFQFPFIATLIAVAIGLTLFISDGHDARVLTLANENATAPATAPASPNPMDFSLEKAVALWKQKNGWVEKGCDQDTASPVFAQTTEPRAPCPRPIIVAGEGGGSRAAFFLASTLGHLQDRSLDWREAKAAGQGLQQFSDRLFAISSVSGSSAGAAFFTGALQYHQSIPPRELASALFRQRLWFQNVARPSRDFLDRHVTYKDALQAAFSTDFLSPALISFGARDIPTFSRLPYVLDRAGVLETTWENTFDHIYGQPGQRSLLAEPFSQFVPSDKRWLPILLFNATSVETGRRVIVSPLSAEEIINDKHLFTEAYDLYELFCAERQAGDLQNLDRISSYLPRKFSPVANIECRNGKPETIDVRLSTAANLGARFPLVSPHANIRDRTGNVTDSLVDGGYFDNSGAVTALELATALKRLDRNLDPFVIQISSEPEWFTTLCVSPAETRTGLARPALPDEADFKPLGTFGNLLTVNATRIARGFQTIAELPDQMEKLNNGKDSHRLIFVCPQQRENIIAKFFTGELRTRSARADSQQQAWKSVALSWWLSPPLQAYLDAQLYSPQNQAAVERILKLLQ